MNGHSENCWTILNGHISVAIYVLENNEENKTCRLRFEPMGNEISGQNIKSFKNYSIL